MLDVANSAEEQVCTTCLSAAGTYSLKHIDFPMVFLDEASMATEPLSLVPLMKGVSAAMPIETNSAHSSLRK